MSLQDRELCAALRAVDEIATQAQGMRGRALFETFEGKFADIADKLAQWQRDHQTALVRAERQA